MKVLIFISTIFCFSLNAQMICHERDKNCMLENSKESSNSTKTNVLKSHLAKCSLKPLTGFYRDGTCRSDHNDFGNHSVCAVMTDEFLKYTLKLGNNLIDPNPRYNFPGLKAGDRWCLCANRWLEAINSGIKVKVDINATHKRALEVVSLKTLKEGTK